MLIKLFGILIIITIATLGVAIVKGNVLAYILCWQVVCIAAFLFLAFLTAKVLWKTLPANLKQMIEKKRRLFDSLVLGYTFAFVLIQKFAFPGTPSGASEFVIFLNSATTFVFIILIMWGLIRQRWVSVSMTFALVSVLLFIFSNTTPRTETGENQDSSKISQLSSLPYFDWVSAEDTIQKQRVTRYNRDLASKGFNLYASRIDPEAYLVDMNGSVVRTWTSAKVPIGWWFAVELCKNGDLLVAVNDKMLVRLDWDSNIRWQIPLRAHHDITVDQEGRIYVLGREDSLISCGGIPLPIVNDFVAAISEDGKIIRKLYLYDLVEDSFGIMDVIDKYRADWGQFHFLERVYQQDRKKGFLQPSSLVTIIGLKKTFG